MTDVYEAAQERIAYVFDNFDRVLISFSGGKDSTVCMHMFHDYAEAHGCLDRLIVYHLDYEAQYSMTTDFVTETFSGLDVEGHWLCLPVGASCGCRMDSATWIPWRKSDKGIWVRDYPDSPCLMTEDTCPFEMTEGQKDYDVQDSFCRWLASEHGGSLAVIIGIRADESMDRRKLVTSTSKTLEIHRHEGKKWTVDSEGFTRIYPIYDWRTEDVWIYLGSSGKPYNRLYDLFYQAGVGIDQMRVANPFHACGMDNLSLYKAIDPDTWGRMVGRVNGVNFAGIYGGTTAMGWKRITKPSHFTWKEYCYFLLGTLDEKTRAHYEEKLETSIRFWKDRGGALEDGTVEDLIASGIECIDRGVIPERNSGKRIISFEDYPDDVDIADFRSCPSYKRMCVCIIKNDYYCKYMGFSQTKTELEKRRRAMALYNDL